MVAVYLNLAWQVKDEVLGPFLLISIFDFGDQPVDVSLEEFHAVNHASIGTELEFFHDIFQTNQFMNIDRALTFVY